MTFAEDYVIYGNTHCYSNGTLSGQIGRHLAVMGVANSAVRSEESYGDFDFTKINPVGLDRQRELVFQDNILPSFKDIPNLLNYQTHLMKKFIVKSSSTPFNIAPTNMSSSSGAFTGSMTLKSLQLEEEFPGTIYATAQQIVQILYTGDEKYIDLPFSFAAFKPKSEAYTRTEILTKTRNIVSIPVNSAKIC